MADLTTLAAVKTWLGIASAQTNADAQLTALVTSTSADFLRAIDRIDFLTASYTEVREGDGGDRLALRHWPITTVTSLNIAGTTVVPQPSPTGSGWYVDTNLDPERLNQLYLAQQVFPDGAQVVVVYVAGYVSPPDDVAQAVVEWVCERYKGRPGQAVTSQRDAGGEHVVYAKEDSMPATTAAVVERYRRTWPTLDRYSEDRNYRITRINRTTRVSENIHDPVSG